VPVEVYENLLPMKHLVSMQAAAATEKRTISRQWQVTKEVQRQCILLWGLKQPCRAFSLAKHPIAASLVQS